MILFFGQRDKIRACYKINFEAKISIRLPDKKKVLKSPEA